MTIATNKSIHVFLSHLKWYPHKIQILPYEKPQTNTGDNKLM